MLLGAASTALPGHAIFIATADVGVRVCERGCLGPALRYSPAARGPSRRPRIRFILRDSPEDRLGDLASSAARLLPRLA
jgi:hypothetical protein